MNITRKKVLKWIKYWFLFTLLLLIAGRIWMNREGKKMYGGLTEKVDSSQFKPLSGVIAIQNANVLSADGEKMLPNRTVLFENGYITAIDSTLFIPSNAIVIDGSQKYVIPGLIDAHVHLFRSPNDLLLYLANGVTEIREMIGEEDHLKWRDEIANGRVGPKMHITSPRLGSFGTIEGWWMETSQLFLNVPDAESGKKTVKQLYEEGYDGIKIYSQLNKEAYEAVTATAQELDMPIYGHIPWDVTFQDVYDNGQIGIAHLEEIMNALRREFKVKNGLTTTFGKEDEFLVYLNQRVESLSDEIIANNITVTSTLWLTQSFYRQKFELNKVLEDVKLEYENPGISEWVSYAPGGLGWLPEVNRYKLTEGLNDDELKKEKKYWKTYGEACEILARRLTENGVKLIAGTDSNLTPTVPGFSLHDELQSLAKAGIGNEEVLRSATSTPATFLNSKSGRIAEGYVANLVILDKNPLEDIKNTTSIHAVINKGEVFDRALLDTILKAVKEANNNSRTIPIDEFL